MRQGGIHSFETDWQTGPYQSLLLSRKLAFFVNGLKLVSKLVFYAQSTGTVISGRASNLTQWSLCVREIALWKTK